jgi:carbamoyl-phosphate synthase large subunit
MVDLAVRCTLGEKLKDMGYGTGLWRNGNSPYYAVKVPVYSFLKLHGVDTMLGPEMKSTGEVMGVGGSFAEAYVKSQLAAGDRFPKQGKVFLSVRQSDKNGIVEVARDLLDLGFELVATRGTAQMISEQGLPVTAINKVTEGRPHVVDMIKNGEICLVINTVDEKRQAVQDSYSIRRSALQGRIPQYTTLAGARTWRGSISPAPIRRRSAACCRAASATACTWPSHSRRKVMCCFWTSRPTTSTSIRCVRWRRVWRISPAAPS